MNTRLLANVSIAGTFLMILLSFSFGFSKYTETRKAMVTDLNQALQHTILQNGHRWMSRDSIQTYAKLSGMFGNPVSIESFDKDFSEALNHAPDKAQTGIVIHVSTKKATRNVSPNPISKARPDYYIVSDTLIWASSTLTNPDSTTEDIGISFQGYVNCSVFEIIGLTDKSLPGLFLGLAFLSATLSLLFKRQKQQEIPNSFPGEKIITFGNIRLSCETGSFHKENDEKLKLTPQQYSLLEMFFLSSTHILTRSDICESLWPGKINADETLNTLVRRLRPLIEENSNLKITTDRGRAYMLEERTADC